MTDNQRPTSHDRSAPDEQPPLYQQQAWERELDALVRPSFMMAPPPDVQHAILAAVLQAAAVTPQPAVVRAAPTPIPATLPARPLPLSAYLLLAAVLVAYLAGLSWLHGLFSGGGWLPTLVNQLLAASDLLVGLPSGDPFSLTGFVLRLAPWLALLPLVWLLWERDRAATTRTA